jgi:integrase
MSESWQEGTVQKEKAYKADNSAASVSAKRPRGTGSLYKQRSSPNWWIQYYRNGKSYRQSTGTTNRRKAERMLAKKLAEISTYTFIEPRAERTLVSELAQDMLREYKINARKSLDAAKTRWEKHLAKSFGELRAVNVNSDDLTRYVAQRQHDRASNATINRELAVLKRAFSLGVKAKKVFSAPSFPRLEERNIRKGFVEDAQYQALAKACSGVGLWMRAMFEVAYNFGWRVGELLDLRVRQIDLTSRTIRLDPGMTKNDDGRLVVMTGLVYALLQQCVVGKQADEHVFTRDSGKVGKVSTPVLDFRGTWEKVRKQAGVSGLLFHDLRRTAVRNMVRRGIPERVAMTISGHKTRSVFDRYNIVSENDLREAARKLEQGSVAGAGIDGIPVEFKHSSDILGASAAPVAPGPKLN